MEEREILACTPQALNQNGFNLSADLPYGHEVDHLRNSMQDLLNFLGFVNQQLHSREIQRLESMLMPANFSSIVGEFMSSTIPRYCSGLVKNRFHNGHPDLLPRGMFKDDAAQHVSEGIEIKASRRMSGWQGHNPEDVWLMVFVFDSNTNNLRDMTPRPFRFVSVFGGRLTRSDWSFSGRSGESRRTITASVTRLGYQKMASNWIYRA